MRPVVFLEKAFLVEVVLVFGQICVWNIQVITRLEKGAVGRNLTENLGNEEEKRGKADRRRRARERETCYIPCSSITRTQETLHKEPYTLSATRQPTPVTAPRSASVVLRTSHKDPIQTLHLWNKLVQLSH